MNDEVIPLLKVHGYFQGASDETLEEVARLGRVAQYPAGGIVHEADVVLTTVGFVLRGRLKAVRVNANGTESLFRMIERGEQFGMMVGALGEAVPIRVVALEPTTVLRLDYEEAMELTLARPELRRLWLKTYAGGLRKIFLGDAPKRSVMILTLIHDSPATRPLAERLIQRLSDIGEQLAILSDSDRRWDSPSAPTIIPNCSPRSIMRKSDSVPLPLTRTALSRPRRTKPTVVSKTSASWTTLPAGYCATRPSRTTSWSVSSETP